MFFHHRLVTLILHRFDLIRKLYLNLDLQFSSTELFRKITTLSRGQTANINAHVWSSLAVNESGSQC